jgi:hypothetical protein
MSGQDDEITNESVTDMPSHTSENNSSLFGFGCKCEKKNPDEVIGKSKKKRRSTKPVSKKASATYTKTTRKHTDKKGVARVIFTKDGNDYIRKKRDDGTFRYAKI